MRTLIEIALCVLLVVVEFAMIVLIVAPHWVARQARRAFTSVLSRMGGTVPPRRVGRHQGRSVRSSREKAS
jgi:hypothetical protein